MTWRTTDLKYYALPDRLYLIGRDGHVAYRGGPGPFGFVAAELEHAIEDYLKCIDSRPNRDNAEIAVAPTIAEDSERFTLDSWPTIK